MVTQLSVWTIMFRLLLATFISGVIGLDRAYKHRPAGLRTHILVCLGACIIAMIQKEIGFNAIQMAKEYPQYRGVLRADEARLIAQVVSGIGFLGAGTIIVEHHSIRGLTTAASLWVIACVGLAVGMGYYIMAICSFLVVYGVVGFLKQIIRVNPIRKIEVQYKHKAETKEFINNYFEKNNIKVEDVRFQATKQVNEYTYTNVYEIDMNRKMNYVDIVEDLSSNQNILKVGTISV